MSREEIIEERFAERRFDSYDEGTTFFSEDAVIAITTEDHGLLNEFRDRGQGKGAETCFEGYDLENYGEGTLVKKEELMKVLKLIPDGTIRIRTGGDFPLEIVRVEEDSDKATMAHIAPRITNSQTPASKSDYQDAAERLYNQEGKECDCGAFFDSENALNGHKAHCDGGAE